ncbi:aldehyde dehydrogenase family protein [Neptuniibacter sp.]|uniref:aldehyde dehydrogenase family protein n=1 Tax=Neptuniibacter sp. TaxID=1962643 RepID=UPI002613E251|nr:aldehyde dehydrogenase family protein [Neptuniibacter sp.]MCP4595973.1 aldehyde dehydrogenase family protein [Neptuniibacter sp.]
MNNNYNMIINGQPVAPGNGSFPVIDPATASPFADCPCASVAQLDQAVDAAEAAFKSWKLVSHEERQALLHKIADKIEENAAELAEIIVKEQGKPMFLAQMEVGGSVGWTRYTADLEVPVEVVEDSENKRIEMHRKPIGVVGSILPWNWPLMIAVWHIMPALRTGNTVVVKPSPLTPFNTLRLVELINEVVPAGVVNIVTDQDQIGPAMSSHEKIGKIVFTGSTPTGQHIMRSAAANLKRLTLELGGNDGGIVLPGADLDAIAGGIFQTAFLNMGQTCAALKRLYVHESQYDELAEKLINIAKEQKVGSGFEEGVTFGPMQNKMQYDLVNGLIDDARSNGATINETAAIPEGEGYFIAPTIVTGAKDGMALVDKEQFGAALPIIAYSDVEDAIARVNASENGLGGSVWGSDLDEAQRIASQLECGTAWINGHAEVLPHAPFGGCKMSGFGVEFGQEGLLEYTTIQVVNINK